MVSKKIEKIYNKLFRLKYVNIFKSTEFVFILQLTFNLIEKNFWKNYNLNFNEMFLYLVETMILNFVMIMKINCNIFFLKIYRKILF